MRLTRGPSRLFKSQASPASPSISIRVNRSRSGGRLGRLSAIAGEGEVLLLPNVRLVVTAEAREVEGWLTIDLLESEGDYTY